MTRLGCRCPHRKAQRRSPQLKPPLEDYFLSSPLAFLPSSFACPGCQHIGHGVLPSPCVGTAGHNTSQGCTLNKFQLQACHISNKPLHCFASRFGFAPRLPASPQGLQGWLESEGQPQLLPWCGCCSLTRFAAAEESGSRAGFSQPSPRCSSTSLGRSSTPPRRSSHPLVAFVVGQALQPALDRSRRWSGSMVVGGSVDQHSPLCSCLGREVVRGDMKVTEASLGKRLEQQPCLQIPKIFSSQARERPPEGQQKKQKG